MEEREEERKKKVADKRAAEARRRLREVQVDDYQPNQWENKDEIEEVTTAVERIGFHINPTITQSNSGLSL